MCIYLLCEPETKQPRYVGQTITSGKRRLQQHLYDAKQETRRMNKKLKSWLKGLLEDGQLPKVYEIEGKYIEKKVIRDLVSDGIILYNIHHNRKGIKNENNDRRLREENEVD